MDRQELYDKLWHAYQLKGKIGPVKPKNNEHAKKICYMAALSIYERNNKYATTR